MERIDWIPTVILSGNALGVDQLGEKWAKEHNVPVELYPANWDRFGRSAGYKRNADMAKRAQALVAVWDGAGTEVQNTWVLVQPISVPW
jgi:hypothetical protein